MGAKKSRRMRHATVAQVSVADHRLIHKHCERAHPDCGLSLIQWQGRSCAPTRAADVYWTAICTAVPAIQAALT
jgi:hypothetical protein